MVAGDAGRHRLPEGIVMLNGDIIGSFAMDGNEKIAISLTATQRGGRGVTTTVSAREMLEFATGQGLSLDLMLNPDFNAVEETD